VIGFVAGPPCETWSRARGVPHGRAPPADGDGDAAPGLPVHGRGLPRILRALSELWGLMSLGIRELCQILTGNSLLIFALEAIVEIALAGSVGLVEHPAEPDDLVDASSIWRLPVMDIILHLPCVEKIRFAQGLLGAKTAKPTELLCVNLPSMMQHLHANRVRKELPRGQSVGKDGQGHWRTSSLKEYAPALCKAISEALRAAFDPQEVAAEHVCVPQHLLDICHSMQVQTFGSNFGPDYAR